MAGQPHRVDRLPSSHGVAQCRRSPDGSAENAREIQGPEQYPEPGRAAAAQRGEAREETVVRAVSAPEGTELSPAVFPLVGLIPEQRRLYPRSGHPDATGTIAG